VGLVRIEKLGRNRVHVDRLILVGVRDVNRFSEEK
jgi:hypothetical protein